MLRLAFALAASVLVACSGVSPSELETARDGEPNEAAAPNDEAGEDGAPGAPSPGKGTDAPGKPPRGDELGGAVGKWSWLDVPGSMCGNGSATGIGVNLGTSSELLVFMAGGRACWDEVTCSGGLAKNFKDGYAKEAFEADLADAEGSLGESLNGGIFDRSLEANPYKDASFILIPYCTGDVHAGDTTKETLFGDPLHFAGRKNYELALAKIAPAFAHVSRVTLSGSSAGGFGAALNYWRTQDAFGKVRVDLVNDSGPPFEANEIALLETWRAAWDLDGALPPDCAGCKANLAELPGYYAKKYPNARQALMSYDKDAVISIFYATAPNVFADRLEKHTETRLSPLANSRSFYPSGSTHTMLKDLSTKVGDLTAAEWLRQMHSDSKSWSNVAP